ERVRRALIVDRLARVLLQVDALDAHGLGCAAFEVEHDLALAHHRELELADLVALRQVRIEVVLAVEARPFVDLRAERQPGLHRLTHALAVDDRQHARHGGVHKAHLRVRLRAEGGGRAREQLGVGDDLRMDLHADHHLPVTGRAANAIGFGLAHFTHHFSGLAENWAACSITWPAFSMVSSSSLRPIRCRPSGNPFASTPAGTESAGRPAMEAGTVNTSFRYIASGSSALEPNANAALGVVGVRITSHCS